MLLSVPCNIFVSILIAIEPTSYKSKSIEEIVGLAIKLYLVPRTPITSKSFGTLYPISVAAFVTATARESLGAI